MARSTKLEKLLIDPLNSRLSTLEARSLVDEGDNISLLNNDAGYQNAAQVDSKIQAVVGAAPAALDTLKEIADQLATEDSAIAALVSVNTTQTTNITANTTAIANLGHGAAATTAKLLLSSNFNLADYPQARLHIEATANITGTLPPLSSTRAFIIKNSDASTGNITINGSVVPPGSIYEVSSDGTSWLEW